MHNVSRLGSRQGFTRQILIDKGVKAFPQSRFCHSREETSMNRFCFQQGICYPRRKFRRLSLAEYSLFPDVSGVLLPPQGQGKDVCVRERYDVTAGSMPVKARFRAMNKKMNKMNSNKQSCRSAIFSRGTVAAQHAREFLEPLTPSLKWTSI